MDLRYIHKFFLNINKRNSYFFSLIEVIFVLAIIGILSGLLIINQRSTRALARDKQRIADLAAYQNALHEYYSKHKKYPISNSDCIAHSSGCLEVLLEEDFLSALPKDPLSESPNYVYWYSKNSMYQGQEYKLFVTLEMDTLAMERDGGIVSTAYEVFSTLGTHISVSYPGYVTTQFLSCDITTVEECNSRDGVNVLGLAGKRDEAMTAAVAFEGGAHSQVKNFSWMDENWKYRKPVIIDNFGGAELNYYPIEIDISNAIYNENGLIGSWHLNEWSGTIASDTSGYGHPGILNNGPIRVSGRFGSALDFSGGAYAGSYVHIGNKPIFDVDPGEARTIEAWFKAGTQSTTYGHIVWKEGCCIGWTLKLQNNGDVVSHFYSGTGCCSGMSRDTVKASDIDYDDNQWHHAVAVIDRQHRKFELYVDGERKDITSINNTKRGYGGSLRIGTNYNNSQPFDGVIDEVRIYDRALRSAEILAHFNAEKARLDYGDIRFTNSNGTSPLYSVLLSDKKARVIVPSIPADLDPLDPDDQKKTIYLYYGNPSASFPFSPIIFEDGFESGDASAWNSQWESNGTLSFPAISPYEGNRHARFVANSGSGNKWGGVSKHFSTDIGYQELYMRGYFKFDSLPEPGGIQPFFMTREYPTYDWQTSQAELINEAGIFRWRVNLHNDSGVNYDDPSSPVTPAVDRWYCIELYTKIGTNPGEAKLWIDGQLEAQIGPEKNVDVDGWNSLGRLYARTGHYGSSTTIKTYDFDDIIISENRIGCDPTPAPIIRIKNSEQSLYDEYCICCTGPPDIGADCTAENSKPVLSLSDVTNAHAQPMIDLLTDWQYRRSILIDNTQGNVPLTNYPVIITLGTSGLINGIPQKMQSDCKDIRFADSDAITRLDHYVEGPCDDPATRIWVRVPSIPANNSHTIFLYYGNFDPGIVPESDELAVCPGGVNQDPYNSQSYCYEFFDDFEGTSLDLQKWSVKNFRPDPDDPRHLQCAPGDDPSDPSGTCYCDNRFELVNFDIDNDGEDESTLHVHVYSEDMLLTPPFWTAGPCGFSFTTKTPIDADTFDISVEGRYQSEDPLLGTSGHLGQGHVLTPHINDGMAGGWYLGYYLNRMNNEAFKMDRVIDGGVTFRADIPDTFPANEDFEYIKLGKNISLKSIGTYNHSYLDDIGLLEMPFTFGLSSTAGATDAYGSTQTIEYDVYWDSVLIKKHADPIPGITIRDEEIAFTAGREACLSAAPVRDIICEYRKALNCFADETTLCSLSSHTNAHIGISGKYYYNVCCKITM